MSEPAMARSHAIETGELCNDAETLDARRKTLSKMRWGPILNSISHVLAMFGGPLFGSGLLAVCFALAGNPGSVAMWLGLTMTGVGMVLQFASTGLDYISTRSLQGCSFDQVEVCARSTAKHLAKELKKDLGYVPANDQDNPIRRDGKTWLESTSASRRRAEQDREVM